MRYTKYAFTVPEEKIVRVITDTDAKNEADDQFAIVHALLSPRIENVGFIASHFGDRNGPDSMEKSYAEIGRVFDEMRFDPEGMIYKGAGRSISDENPAVSEGARLIVSEAMKDDPRRLFVTFLGPLTDLAAAYLNEPRIAGRLTAIWIGGGKYPLGGQEFNLSNDINAANIVFGSGIDLWQVPKNVYEMMAVSLAELEVKVRPYGRIGAYLFDQLSAHALEEIPRKSVFRTGETWVLGDNPAIGLILYEHRFLYDMIPAPRVNPDMTYAPGDPAQLIRVYNSIDSRLVLEDLFSKIQLLAR
ncbi:hypothetical protein FACS18948_3440 [Clostridia bacterium]|nr:hypothetical protein FACS18948_3440 [Clostridia bacterium]